jgi:hypothetical protein
MVHGRRRAHQLGGASAALSTAAHTTCHTGAIRQAVAEQAAN